MSRYGVDLYGAAYYGATSLVELSADPFVIVSRDHGQLLLTWNTPSGTYDRLRIVRSSYGNPVNGDDGTVVLDVPAAPPVTEFLDTNLTQGVFYYYTIFVRQAVGAGYTWQFSAASQGLVVADHGYSELLLERLPSVFTTTPASVATRPDEEPSLPARFMSIFGFQLDSVRTTYESLRDTKDADRVGGQLLPLLARELGQAYEPEIGQRQNRVLLRNSVYLFKKKGTTPSITGLASSLTGWGASIPAVTNLVLDEDMASAESSLSSWHVRSGNGTLARRLSDALVNDAVIPPGAVVGYRNPTYSNTSHGLFQLTETGTGAVVLAHVNQGVEGDALRHGIPIDPTKGAITASVFLRDTGTSRTPTLAMDFYDRRGGLLSAPTATATSGATASDWTRRNSVTVTAANVPTNARYIGLRLTYPTAANTEVQFFDGFQVEYASSPTTYRPARQIRVVLSPNRVNLVTNPNFELNATGWTALSNASSLARSTSWANTGNASLSVTAPAAGDSILFSSYVDAAVGANVTFSAVVRAPVATTARMRIQFDNAAGTAALSFVDGPTIAVPANTPTRVYATGTVPAGGGHCRVEPLLTATASGQVWYVDDVLAELGTVLLPYFDGATVGTFDVGWTGTAHASTSVLYKQRAIRDSRLRANIGRYLVLGTPYALEYADSYSPS